MPYASFACAQARASPPMTVANATPRSVCVCGSKKSSACTTRSAAARAKYAMPCRRSLLADQHARAGVVDVEEALQVGELVRRAQRLDRRPGERDPVAPREPEHELGLERALDVQVQLGLRHRPQQRGDALGRDRGEVHRTRSRYGAAGAADAGANISALRRRTKWPDRGAGRLGEQRFVVQQVRPVADALVRLGLDAPTSAWRGSTSRMGTTVGVFCPADFRSRSRLPDTSPSPTTRHAAIGEPCVTRTSFTRSPSALASRSTSGLSSAPRVPARPSPRRPPGRPGRAPPSRPSAAACRRTPSAR